MNTVRDDVGSSMSTAKTGNTYRDLGKELINIKDGLGRHTETTTSSVFMRMLKRLLNRAMTEEDVEAIEPIGRHQLEERTQLQQILCDLSTDLSRQDIVNSKVPAINLMIPTKPRSPLAYNGPLKE